MSEILDLLSLLIGFLIGWKGREISDKVTALYRLFEERIEAPGGVVKIQPKRLPTRGHVSVADDSDTGPVVRPTPMQAKLDRKNDREEHERRNYNEV